MDRNQIKVSIIEDNREVNEGFAELINTDDNFSVVSSYFSCEEALPHIKKDAPDIVLMDIGLPGMNGIKGTTEVKKLLPATEVIIITIHENSSLVFEALCAGATGYITKNSGPQELQDAMRQIVNGGAPMSANIAKMVVKSFQKNPHSPLTERETEVLTLLSKGKSYSNIADELFLSKETVRTHLKNIYIKLQVSSKSEAIAKASKDKLI